MAELDLMNYKNRHSLKSKMVRVAWGVSNATILRLLPTGFEFLRQIRNFILRCFGAKIGKGSTFHSSARIWQPSNLIMGEKSAIGDRVDCYSVDKIVIGNQVTISQDVYICTASHDIGSPVMELKTAPIIIEDKSWVCARAIILPGIRIGEGAVIAAGAVVTKDVAPWTVVGGNPAVVISGREIKDGD